jgi:Ca2+-binding EF-hand superfamily protein
MRNFEQSLQAFTAKGKEVPAATVKLPWANQIQNLHVGAEPTEAFTKLDLDKDGFLSAEEISLANPMDRERTCNAETAVMCADKDDSGSISPEEFADEKGIQSCYMKNEPLCHGSGVYRDQAVIFDNEHGVLVIWNKDHKVYQLVNSTLTNTIREDFRKADKDQDGVVTGYEMAALAPKDSKNPLCTGEIMMRCADEDASNSLDLIEYADMFNEQGLVDDFKTCMAQNKPLCTVTKTPSWNASGIPTASYSPALCRRLFAYRHTRDLCFRLQPEVCGKDCKEWGDNNTDECKAFQEMFCQLPKHTNQSEPLSVGTVPKGKKTSVATVCIAVSNWGPNELWLAREDKNASDASVPLATRLAYMNCVQVHTFEGEVLQLYSGGRQVLSWNSGKRNEVMMVGREEKGLTKAKITRFSFKDEEMLRPVLCNAAPDAAEITVHVEGKQWHALVDNVDGVLGYLHCQVLLLDHDDSLREPESLEIVSNNAIQLVMPVSPVQSLFLVNQEENGVLSYQAHNLGFLKY